MYHHPRHDYEWDIESLLNFSRAFSIEFKTLFIPLLTLASDDAFGSGFTVARAVTQPASQSASSDSEFSGGFCDAMQVR